MKNSKGSLRGVPAVFPTNNNNMLIRYKRADGTLMEVKWSFGQPNPFLGANYGILYWVGEVVATGNELAYIRNKFTHLPDVPNHTQVTWFGDDAKFIAANLG